MESATKEQISKLVASQRQYFKSGETFDINFRINQLKKLKQMVIDNEEAMTKAMYEDLGRHYVEAYLVKDDICVGKSEPFVVNIVNGAIVL